MLELTRITQNGWDDGARAYLVYIDGKKEGAIREGETKQFDVSEGEHTIQLKIDWCSSPVRTFTMEAGKTVYARCAPAKKPFLIGPLLYITIFARRYVDLEIVE